MTLTTLQGRRVADETEPHLYVPGDYGRLCGNWYCAAPSGDLGNLRGHTVTEHPDGTITVEPSILIYAGYDGWHGLLRAGVWSEL